MNNKTIEYVPLRNKRRCIRHELETLKRVRKYIETEIQVNPRKVALKRANGRRTTLVANNPYLALNKVTSIPNLVTITEGKSK